MASSIKNIPCESINLTSISPEKIRVEQVTMKEIIHYQHIMSKAVWRPPPGRKLGFFIFHVDTLLGIISLGSPVINLKARDEFLNLDRKNRGKSLRHYMDMDVCVGTQPVSWFWNIGKLLALLATSLGDYFEYRYGDELYGIITTSYWGRSTQYNRIYKFLGFTKGYGHSHISDEEYENMLLWMKENNVEIPGSKFGDGSNPRMRRILAYYKASGNKGTLKHGNVKGIYYHEATDPNKRDELITDWYNRWGIPRYNRKKDEIPPYITGQG